MNDKQREAILEELDRYLSRPKLQSDEITVKMVMARHHLSEKVARYKMDSLVEAGYCTKRRVFHEGYWCNAYRPVGNCSPVEEER